MSISDAQMWLYYELLTDLSPDEIAELRNRVERGEFHPMTAKLDLAEKIIAGFHSPDAAATAREEWRRVFSERQNPEAVPERSVPRGAPKRLSRLLVELELAASNAEAQRLISQGGVEVDGVRVDDVKAELDLAQPREFLLRAGKKKFLRLRVP
jgi:tyrosyl-tRNA synthetase